MERYGDVVRVDGVFFGSITADDALGRALEADDAGLAREALDAGAGSIEALAKALKHKREELFKIILERAAPSWPSVVAEAYPVAVKASAAPAALITDETAVVPPLVAANAAPTLQDRSPCGSDMRSGPDGSTTPTVEVVRSAADVRELIYCALRNHCNGVAEMFLNRGVTANGIMLEDAFRYNNIDGVRLLIAHGVNVLERPWGLFGIACSRGSVELLTILFSKGFSDNLTDNVRSYFWREITKIAGRGDERHVGVLRALLSHPAAAGLDLDHLLLFPVERSNIAITRVLIEAGARGGAASSAALVRACRAACAPYSVEEAWLDMIQLLLVSGADARARDNYPLRAALGAQRYAIARLLLAHGADAALVPAELRAALGLRPVPPAPRPADDECRVDREPIAPGAAYRRCTSNVPHTVAADYACGAFMSVCPVCRAPYSPDVYINQ